MSKLDLQRKWDDFSMCKKLLFVTGIVASLPIVPFVIAYNRIMNTVTTQSKQI